MLSNNISKGCKLNLGAPLLKPLFRGKQQGAVERNAEQSNYEHLVKREAYRQFYKQSRQEFKCVEIVVNDVDLNDDPMSIIKLVMDALQGVCYRDDAILDDVTFKFLQLKPKESRRDAYLEIRVGNQMITIKGIARGKRYPLYDEAYLVTLAKQYTLIKQSVLASIQQHPVYIAPQQRVDILVNIEQYQSTGDIDNIALNYWEALKSLTGITNNLVEEIRICRTVGVQDWINISVYQ